MKRAIPLIHRQAALIRGINVGTAKRVAMADLRALVAELGYTEVQTLLNSGNIVYTVPAGLKEEDAAARIEARIAARLGVSARVLTRTADEIAAVIAGHPWPGIVSDPSRFLVAFLCAEADPAKLAPLMKQDWTPEALAAGRRAVYLWCPGGINDSKLVPAVNRALSNAVTARNWSTVARLHALLSGPH